MVIVAATATILLSTVAPPASSAIVIATWLTMRFGQRRPLIHVHSLATGPVAVESAIATFLLIATILLLMSLWRLLTVPLGFEAEQVLTFELRLLDLKYRPPGQSHPRQRASGPMGLFQNALADRVRALPGVQDVGVTSAVPFRGVDPVYSLNRIGERRRYSANARFVDSGYFAVFGLAWCASGYSPRRIRRQARND